jgi:hypothetical protein
MIAQVSLIKYFFLACLTYFTLVLRIGEYSHSPIFLKTYHLEGEAQILLGSGNLANDLRPAMPPQP